MPLQMSKSMVDYNLTHTTYYSNTTVIKQNKQNKIKYNVI